MQVIVLFCRDGAALTLDVRAVAGKPEACMAYGEQLAREMEEAGISNVEFVLTDVETPAVQCFMPGEPRALRRGDRVTHRDRTFGYEGEVFSVEGDKAVVRWDVYPGSDVDGEPNVEIEDVSNLEVKA